MASSLLDFYEGQRPANVMKSTADALVEVLVWQVPFLERHVDTHIRQWQVSPVQLRLPGPTDLYLQVDGEVSHIQDLIEQLCIWYNAWHPQEEYGHFAWSHIYELNPCHRFGPSFANMFKRSFTANLHVALPPQFHSGFVALVRSSLTGGGPAGLFAQLEILGVLDHFESLIASVICNLIEERILETCPQQWATPQLAALREWLGEAIVPAATSYPPHARHSKPSHRTLSQTITDRCANSRSSRA